MLGLYHQIIHYNLEGNYYKISISDKIKAINNKIDQTKAQYDLDTQTAKFSTLLSKNVCKYKFLTGTDVLPEKYLLEKAAALKRFEHSVVLRIKSTN